MTTIVLVDQTNGATTSDGGALNPELLAQIAAAATVQANRDLAEIWGLPLGGLLIRVDQASNVADGEWPFLITPNLPEPGAIAYHSVDGRGVPALFDGITLSDSLIRPGNSLSVAVTHEICEALVDRACNEWIDDGAGTEWAKEACDAVEATDYIVDGIAVANLVTPLFFDPGASGPFDYLELVKTPFQTLDGGYQISRTLSAGARLRGRITRRHDKRLHPKSRTARRLGFARL